MVILLQRPAIVADLVVLAIDALQVAMCKKNITDALCSAYDGFFAFVDTDGADVEGGIAFAPPKRTCYPVGMTFPGTECAIC